MAAHRIMDPELFEEQVFRVGAILFMHFSSDFGVKRLPPRHREHHFGVFLQKLQIPHQLDALLLRHGFIHHVFASADRNQIINRNLIHAQIRMKSMRLGISAKVLFNAIVVTTTSKSTSKQAPMALTASRSFQAHFGVYRELLGQSNQ